MDIYTPEDIAIKIINNIDIEPNSIILDPCSGINKVFYNIFPEGCIKYNCEIDEGNDFYYFNDDVDYIISNPPYQRKLLWKFIEHSLNICRKEINFLINIDCVNVLTSKSFKIIEDKGFKVHIERILEIKKWYGRYVFLSISKIREGGIKFIR